MPARYGERHGDERISGPQLSNIYLYGHRPYWPPGEAHAHIREPLC